MDKTVLAQIGQKIVANSAFGDDTTVVWHAGEPCVLSPDWYATATDILATSSERHYLRQSFQTNATLVDDGWVDYFSQPYVSLGVSLDGPQSIHDRCRRTRVGGGTHRLAMRGIERLNRANVPFHIITVISAHSMDRPKEVARALVDTGARWIGLNVEEVEGIHTQSTLFDGNSVDQYRRFLHEFLSEVARAPEPPLVREYERFRACLVTAHNRPQVYNQENVPGAIISVGANGDISTFSPELLDTNSESYGSFVFGNVADISDLSAIYFSARFMRAQRDIHAGVTACRLSCAHFDVCGGGSPSNKLGEHGTFLATETQHCTYATKVLFETLLERTLTV